MEPLFSLIKNTLKRVFLNNDCIWWNGRLNARIRNCSFIFSDVTRANKLTEKINPSDLSNSFILSSTYWIQYYCVCASFVLCGHMYTQTEQLRNSGWLMMAWYKKRSLRQGFVICVCVCVLQCLGWCITAICFLDTLSKLICYFLLFFSLKMLFPFQELAAILILGGSRNMSQ